MQSHDHKELAPQRWDRLRALIRESGVIGSEEICRRLAVSPRPCGATSTNLSGQAPSAGTRRAVSVESRLEEPLFENKTFHRRARKAPDRQAAFNYVVGGETIYLDGGSTLLELARLLRERSDITVVTNSLRAATELAGRGPRLILIGGELRRLSQTLVDR